MTEKPKSFSKVIVSLVIMLTVGRSEHWSGLTTLMKGSITYFTGTVTDEDSKPVWLFGQYVGASRLKTLALVETEEEANALMLQYAEQIRAIEDYPEITGGI